MIPTFVYLIEAEIGRVKIGYGQSVRDREQACRAHSPVKTRLIAYWPGAKDDEEALHAHFAKHRVHGEWFKVEGGFAAYVASMRGKNVPIIPEWDDLSFSCRKAFKKLRAESGRMVGGFLVRGPSKKTPRDCRLPSGLTRRQAETLDFISTFSADQGFSPTYEEIKVHLGLKSKSGVARIVDALVERGHIEKLPYGQRTLVVCASHRPWRSLSLNHPATVSPSAA